MPTMVVETWKLSRTRTRWRFWRASWLTLPLWTLLTATSSLSTCLQEQAQSPSSWPKTIVVSVVIAIYTRWMDLLKLCHFQFFEFTENAGQLESTGATLIFMATALHQKVIFWTPIKLGDVWALMTRYHRLHLFSGAVGRMVHWYNAKATRPISALGSCTTWCRGPAANLSSPSSPSSCLKSTPHTSISTAGSWCEEGPEMSLNHQEGLLWKNTTALEVLLIFIHLQVPYCNKALLEKRI